MSLITQTDLENRVKLAEVVRYSGGIGTTPNAARVTDAIAKAENRMRSEIIKVFTAASWDALTEGTCPDVAKIHLVSDAIDLLSAGNARPEEIESKALEARLFRIRIAKNEERCFDAVLSFVGSAVSNDQVRVATPTARTMDMTNTRSGMYYREQPL